MHGPCTVEEMSVWFGASIYSHVPWLPCACAVAACSGPGLDHTLDRHCSLPTSCNSHFRSAERSGRLAGLRCRHLQIMAVAPQSHVRSSTSHHTRLPLCCSIQWTHDCFVVSCCRSSSVITQLSSDQRGDPQFQAISLCIHPLLVTFITSSQKSKSCTCPVSAPFESFNLFIRRRNSHAAIRVRECRHPRRRLDSHICRPGQDSVTSRKE